LRSARFVGQSVWSKARRGDRAVHVLGLGGRGAAQHQSGRGADVVELRPRHRDHEFAVDEQPGLGPRCHPPAQIDAGLGTLLDHVAHLHLRAIPIRDDQL